MAASDTQLHLLLFLLILIEFCSAHGEDFVECMSKFNQAPCMNREYVYSPDSPSFFNILQSTVNNARWKNRVHQRPKFIVTPNNNDQIKAAISCAKAHAFQIRVLSGGHDYEGISFRSKNSFVLLHLINLHSISINMDDETAWVQTGATVGQLYYTIAQNSYIHAFPAGLYPTVGVGGHISGGGIGTLLRKYGLAADNIVDAQIMNANGEILDRKSMGEDLFWAIRGGGGASFGVILAWRLKLVRVPSVMTVFTLTKQLDDQGIEVVDKWQHIANKLPQHLFIRLLLQNTNAERSKFAHATFNSLYLGAAKELSEIKRVES